MSKVLIFALGVLALIGGIAEVQCPSPWFWLLPH
jgi:hypothetical protein